LNNNAGDTHNQSEFLKDLSYKLLNIVNTMLKRTGALEEQLFNPKPAEPSTTNIKGIDMGDTNSKVSSSTQSKKYDHEGNIINRPKNNFDEQPINSKYAQNLQKNMKGS